MKFISFAFGELRLPSLRFGDPAGCEPLLNDGHGPHGFAPVLTDPPTVQTILRHLDLPLRPPPLAPARAPPQVELAFDLTAVVDPAEPDPIAEFVFDQFLPDEFED